LLSDGALRLRPVGDAAILVELDPSAVLALVAALQERPHPGVTDLVPAERTVLVRFQRRLARPAQIAAWLRSVPLTSAEAVAGPVVELDVHYDGEDLPEVARLTGLSVAGVIAAHTAEEWVVAFSGFAPGFGYLRGPAGLDVPRRAEPRVRVPPGSVALAAGYSGVYPRASPGGWQLIGRTEAVLWDVDQDPPALLRPGVRVRFRALGDAPGDALGGSA
jgi:KipI family sensor histidine kinase inhibitor